VLVPSSGLEAQILTDDDTALLVKVDRRDSNHKVNPPSSNPQRWATQTTTTEPTQEEEGEEAEETDNTSDFGSLKQQDHGGKMISYSNRVDTMTTAWDSLHLYRFNEDFNANEIQDVSVCD
jgi:hypothetical protein